MISPGNPKIPEPSTSRISLRLPSNRPRVLAQLGTVSPTRALTESVLGVVGVEVFFAFFYAPRFAYWAALFFIFCWGLIRSRTRSTSFLVLVYAVGIAAPVFGAYISQPFAAHVLGYPGYQHFPFEWFSIVRHVGVVSAAVVAVAYAIPDAERNSSAQYAQHSPPVASSRSERHWS